ncbi:MAG: hypothetical protein LBV08_06135 [Clostridiales bacterium]|nr:hypothetical protein [Clostridiales bacterium]
MKNFNQIMAANIVAITAITTIAIVSVVHLSIIAIKFGKPKRYIDDTGIRF